MARFELATQDIVEAPAGGIDAIFELGLNYCSGRDVDVDLVEAHKWFNIAAMRGDIEAARRRQEIASEMSAFEIAAALRRARDWLSVH